MMKSAGLFFVIFASAFISCKARNNSLSANSPDQIHTVEIFTASADTGKILFRGTVDEPGTFYFQDKQGQEIPLKVTVLGNGKPLVGNYPITFLPKIDAISAQTEDFLIKGVVPTQSPTGKVYNHFVEWVYIGTGGIDKPFKLCSEGGSCKAKIDMTASPPSIEIDYELLTMPDADAQTTLVRTDVGLWLAVNMPLKKYPKLPNVQVQAVEDDGLDINRGDYVTRINKKSFLGNEGSSMAKMIDNIHEAISAKTIEVDFYANENNEGKDLDLNTVSENIDTAKPQTLKINR